VLLFGGFSNSQFATACKSIRFSSASIPSGL
jgi:hypothetical protein